MGQYYYAVNITKKQYLNPHTFSDGAKLLEFGCSSEGMMTGLAILLSDGNNRGGGDLRSDNPIIGSWAGDKIVITGDYADDGKFVTEAEKEAWVNKVIEEDRVTKEHPFLDRIPNLYQVARRLYQNVSEEVIAAMAEDALVELCLVERGCWNKHSKKVVKL